MTIRVAIFATHPIQYQAPVWRRLASRGVVQPIVHYFSDVSVKGAVDEGFATPVAWDTPLLEGYEHIFLQRHSRVAPGLQLRLRNPKQLLRDGGFASVLVAGYAHAFEWQALFAARALGIGRSLRGEFSDRAAARQAAVRSGLRDAVLRRLYASVDTFCVIGQDARDHLRRLGAPADRMYSSPYGVDSDHFERLAREHNRDTARAQLGLAPEQFVILFSGKLIERKGVDVLLDAVRSLTAAHPNVVLVVVGDGPLRKLVIDAQAQLGPERIRPQGFVNQSRLGTFYAAADAFVLPSRHETWGLVVNEAMYFGLPVVVTDNVGCWRDLVRSDAGIVVPVSDVRALSEAITHLAMDRALAVRLGEVGRQRIAEFSVEASALGIEQATIAAARLHDRG